MREVAEHCGVTLADPGSMVVDHVSYDTRLGGIHEVVVSGEYHGAVSIVSEGTRAAPLLYSGLGAVVKPKSKVALPAVTAAASAYTTGGKGGHVSPLVDDHATGEVKLLCGTKATLFSMHCGLLAPCIDMQRIARGVAHCPG